MTKGNKINHIPRGKTKRYSINYDYIFGKEFHNGKLKKQGKQNDK